MPDAPALEFRNVSKIFVQGADRKLAAAIVRGLFSRTANNVFHALDGVSFTVGHGEGMGVIGANGAGKSTLLGLAAGICPADEGEVRIGGRISAVLELGSGFHPLLTGRENLRLNASLLGLDRGRTRNLHDEIVEFAELGEFINEPLRTYSAGMTMRLAFSVAVHLDPDILILDEVFAVGDAAFQDKCRRKMSALRKEGKTILCASHSPATIANLCDRAILLEHGRLKLGGPAEQVLAAHFGDWRRTNR